jgi:peptidoglycan/LPS O-acetylase OafA/YrhL
LFYLQDILGYGDPINHVYWTLSIEIQMYIAFCAAVGVLQAMGVRYRPVLTLALIVSLAWPLGFFHSPIRRFFLDHEYCFLAGSVAWWAIERSTPRWMVIAAAGALLALSVSRDGDYKIWATFGTAILLVTAGKLGTLYTWLGSWPVQFVGSISYGLYLVHDPVIALTLRAQRRLGLTSTSDAIMVLLFVYLASFAVAYAVRRLVEIPSIRLSHKLKRRSHPATIDLIALDLNPSIGAAVQHP